MALGSVVALIGLVLVLVQPSPAGSLAQLEVIEDDVEVKVPERGKYDQVGSGAPLAEGSVIRTDHSGLASVSYSDGSLTRIGPGSTYELVKLRTEDGRREIVGNLDTGQTFHRVSKVTGSGSRFEVHTSKAVAAVRGTAFAVQCFTSVTCEVAVTEGTVAVITPDGREVSVPAGKRVMVAADGQLGDLKPLSKSDAWLAANSDLDESAPAEPASSSGASDEDDQLALSDDSDGPARSAYRDRSGWSRDRSASSSEDDASADAPAESSSSDETTTTTAGDEGRTEPQPRRTTSAAPPPGSGQPAADSSDETTTTTTEAPTTTTEATTTTTTEATTTSTTARPTTTTTRATSTTTTAGTGGSGGSGTGADGNESGGTGGGGGSATTTTTTTQPSTTTSTTASTTPTTGSTTTSTQPCAEGDERVDGECKPPCPHGRDRQTGNCGADPNGRSNSDSSPSAKANGSAQTMPFLWLFGFLFGGTVFVRRDPSSWED